MSVSNFPVNFHDQVTGLKRLVFLAYYHLDRLLNFFIRGLRFLRGILGDYMIAQLAPEAWASYNIECYRRNPRYAEGYTDYPLFEWEQHALEHYFPKPPAHILVLAAGCGRECLQLIKAGYKVSAIEPVQEYYNILKKNLGDQLQYHKLQDFNGFIEDNREQPDLQFAGVIVSWCSISHTATMADRIQLLKTCNRVCTQGPILISWLRKGAGIGYHRRAFRAWLWKCGLRGQKLNNTFTSELGPQHSFTNSEIRELIAAAGLRTDYFGSKDFYANAVVSSTNVG